MKADARALGFFPNGVSGTAPVLPFLLVALLIGKPKEFSPARVPPLVAEKIAALGRKRAPLSAPSPTAAGNRAVVS